MGRWVILVSVHVGGVCVTVFRRQTGASGLFRTMYVSVVVVVVVLLWTRSVGCSDPSDPTEQTADDFYSELHSGKTMFIYFQQQGTYI